MGIVSSKDILKNKLHELQEKEISKSDVDFWDSIYSIKISLDVTKIELVNRILFPFSIEIYTRIL